MRKYVTVGLGLLATALIAALIPRQPRKHTQGRLLQLATDTCDCYLDSPRIVVLHIFKGGEIAIGSERIPDGQVPGTLREIYRNRAERVLFLFPENGAPANRIAGLIDVVEHLQSEKPKEPPLPRELQAPPENMKIQIKLVTPQALSAPCPKNCFNWGTQAPLIVPGA